MNEQNRSDENSKPSQRSDAMRLAFLMDPNGDRKMKTRIEMRWAAEVATELARWTPRKPSRFHRAIPATRYELEDWTETEIQQFLGWRTAVERREQENASKLTALVWAFHVLSKNRDVDAAAGPLAARVQEWIGDHYTRAELPTEQKWFGDWATEQTRDMDVLGVEHRRFVHRPIRSRRRA